MKAGWEVKRLGDVCTIVGGGTPPKDQTHYYGGAIPWATVRDMRSTILSETEHSITEEGLRASATNVIPKNNVVVASRVGLGKVCWLTQDTAINQDLRALIPRNAQQLDAAYLFWLMRYRASDFIAAGRGATVQGVTLPFIASLRLPVPSLAEQRRIVEVLDEAFAGLATATANAEQTLASARESFKSYVEEVFRTALNDSPAVPIKSICKNLDGRRRPVTKCDRVAGEIPYYGASGIVDRVRDHLFDEDILLVSEDGANLLARTYPIAFSVSGKCWVNNHAHVLSFADAATQRWTEYYLNSISLAPYVSGMAQPKLNQAALNMIPIPMPDVQVRRDRCDALGELLIEVELLANAQRQKLALLGELKASLLQRAFSGELVKTAIIATVTAANDDFTTPEAAANVIAFAQRRHEIAGTERTFGHVKAQKVLQLIETVGKIDLGRKPIKDAAGPNDFPHMLRAQEWAETQKFFTFVPRHGGVGFDLKKLENYDAMWTRAQKATKPIADALGRAIDLVVTMKSLEAELLATVQAAWNNLILNDAVVTDDAIVREARENWHVEKLKIPRHKFYDAIKLVRARGIVPDGTAKRVGGQEHLL